MIGPGGISMTMGPALRSSGTNAYGVSEFGVKTSWRGLPDIMPTCRLASIPSAVRLRYPAVNATLG
jgi:hypothetical protein